MTHPNKRNVHKEAYDLNEKRKEANREILRRLTVYLENNPGMRFNQALSNMNIVVQDAEASAKLGRSVVADDFYTEPVDVLKRMK